MPTETTRPIPPDVDLIHRARDGARITIKQAVQAIQDSRRDPAQKQAEVSVVRWNQLESDREKRNGVVTHPNPKPITIALMAWAVDRAAGVDVITPERLGTEGDNPVAAVLLAEMLAQDAARTPPPALRPAERAPAAPAGFVPGETIASARPYADDIEDRLRALALKGIAEPSGADLFPDGDDAADWDRAARRGFTIRERVWLVAALQARETAAREREAGTGLSPESGITSPAGHNLPVDTSDVRSGIARVHSVN